MQGGQLSVPASGPVTWLGWNALTNSPTASPDLGSDAPGFSAIAETASANPTALEIRIDLFMKGILLPFSIAEKSRPRRSVSQ